MTDVLEIPEVAFTGDTTIEWVREPSAAAALQARLLILEVTFVGDDVTPAAAQERQVPLNMERFEVMLPGCIEMVRRTCCTCTLDMLEATRVISCFFLGVVVFNCSSIPRGRATDPSVLTCTAPSPEVIVAAA